VYFIILTILLYSFFKFITYDKSSDVKIENNIFGVFNLEKNNFYDFNLETLGRDPTLKRNNIFISKKHIYQLIEKKLIRNPEIILQEIAKEI
jgi:hypothetical protein